MTHHRCPIVLDDDDDDDDARSSTSVVTVFIVLSSSSLSRSRRGSGRRWMHQSIFVDSVGSESIHPWIDRFRSPSPRVRARPARRARRPSRARTTHERSLGLSRKPLGRSSTRASWMMDETDDALHSCIVVRGAQKVPRKCVLINTRHHDRIHLDRTFSHQAFIPAENQPSPSEQGT